MARKFTDQEMLDVLDAYQRYGTRDKAAESLGLHPNTFANRLKRAQEARPIQKSRSDNKIKGPKIQAPIIPESAMDTPDLIDHMIKNYKHRESHATAKKWMSFKVDTDEPIGICWFGDPHVDDDGCNWELLKQHCDIVANTPGMFGANMGDSHNNWVGRLTRLYADQDTSKDTAYRLIDWFFSDSGVKWLIMLLGNHDTFTDDGARLLKKMAENICPMEDWRAQFKLEFTNGREVLIDAAHDHKGHSMWNGLHGQQKASVMGGRAHLYIAGHRHFWALAQDQCGETGRVYWCARTRGYKHIDHYAIVNGFGNQKEGSSIISVINPKAKTESGLIKCFADVQEGADYLTYIRGNS